MPSIVRQSPTIQSLDKRFYKPKRTLGKKRAFDREFEKQEWVKEHDPQKLSGRVARTAIGAVSYPFANEKFRDGTFRKGIARNNETHQIVLVEVESPVMDLETAKENLSHTKAALENEEHFNYTYTETNKERKTPLTKEEFRAGLEKMAAQEEADVKKLEEDARKYPWGNTKESIEAFFKANQDKVEKHEGHLYYANFDGLSAFDEKYFVIVPGGDYSKAEVIYVVDNETGAPIEDSHRFYLAVEDCVSLYSYIEKGRTAEAEKMADRLMAKNPTLYEGMTREELVLAIKARFGVFTINPENFTVRFYSKDFDINTVNPGNSRQGLMMMTEIPEGIWKARQEVRKEGKKKKRENVKTDPKESASKPEKIIEAEELAKPKKSKESKDPDLLELEEI